ncbi:hypothetical protein MHB73_02995 [Bacillus sp. FSL K6-6483]|uniref:hypothetical protein n=2 Tax=Shouchella clausii TaxID=79880 RepID=UPI000BA62979|nr:hypothetical protein [Shouchella clausii]MCM3311359.1 hypothetical protein [Psychrobacillus sp. MER TA 17]PAD46261.1 hypothetical protein CHI09_13210 [Shouchella clausii]
MLLQVGLWKIPFSVGYALGVAIDGYGQDTVWLENIVHVKNIKGTKLIRGEQQLISAFADSGKKYKIGKSQTYENYTSGWGPND